MDADRPVPVLRPGDLLRLVVAFGLLVAVGALAGHLLGVAPVGPDRPVLDALAAHRTAPVTAFLRGVAVVAEPVGLDLTAVVVVGALAWRRRSVALLALALVGVVGAQLLSTAVKVLVDRPRPPVQLAVHGVSAHGSSFPSGHATQSIAVYGLLAFLLARTTRAPRQVLVTATLVAVAAVWLCRLYLGVHWTTDVAAGGLLGSGWLLAVIWTVRRSVREGGA